MMDGERFALSRLNPFELCNVACELCNACARIGKRSLFISDARAVELTAARVEMEHNGFAT